MLFRSFEVVQSNVLSKVYENENIVLKKRMLNLEKKVEKQTEVFDKKLTGFIKAFTKGGI